MFQLEGPRKVYNRGCLVLVRTYSLYGNDMHQNFTALACETALLRIQLQSGVRQARQDFVKALQMLRKCCRKYHNIVQITQTRLPFEATKDRVHESFEGSRSVAQAKGHDVQDVKFIQPSGVANAVFSLSASCMGICQYPERRSRLEKYSAPCKQSKASSMRGIG